MEAGFSRQGHLKQKTDIEGVPCSKSPHAKNGHGLTCFRGRICRCFRIKVLHMCSHVSAHRTHSHCSLKKKKNIRLRVAMLTSGQGVGLNWRSTNSHVNTKWSWLQVPTQ